MCERCGRKGLTQTVVNTQNSRKTVKLCAACIKIVIRPGTAWQVKK